MSSAPWLFPLPTLVELDLIEFISFAGNCKHSVKYFALACNENSTQCISEQANVLVSVLTSCKRGYNT